MIKHQKSVQEIIKQRQDEFQARQKAKKEQLDKMEKLATDRKNKRK